LSQIDLFNDKGTVVFEGDLRKMTTVLKDEVEYTLKWDGQALDMNALLGKEIYLKFDGLIRCMSCAQEIKKTFGQGFCYDCFVNAPQAAECIIHPELCKAHLGEVAVSSAVKVGITRFSQIPTRWIDQGASYAIIVAEVPYRQLSGVLEVALKSMYTDKTNWRKMLTNQVLEGVDLVEEKWQLEDVLPSDLAQYLVEEDEVTTLNYPVLSYPEKVSSINLLKQASISGKLTGIKGQYLLFDNNRVINLRNHSGFNIQLGLCD